MRRKNGSKRWIGILGYPLAHSYSKTYHEGRLREAGLDWEFRTMAWSSQSYKSEIKFLKKDPFCKGFSVTMPYKQTIVSHLDVSDEVVSRIGVVNCVKSRDGRWLGLNTDAVGFLKSFKHWQVIPPKKTAVIFLGTGATARTLSYTLAGEGYRHFIFMNRTMERANQWAEQFKQLFYDADIAVVPWGTALPKQSLFLLNTTPLGMGEEPMEWLDIDGMKRPSWVFDVIYNPKTTPLLKHSQRRCFFTMNGRSMFEAQADLSFACWTAVA